MQSHNTYYILNILITVVFRFGWLSMYAVYIRIQYSALSFNFMLGVRALRLFHYYVYYYIIPVEGKCGVPHMDKKRKMHMDKRCTDS